MNYNKIMNIKDLFRKFATVVSNVVGSAYAFIFAFLVIAAWVITGPIFHFSNTWQLVINTSTTIITFLMVFLIQNTQSRDSKAVHIKLDELLHGVKGARDSMVNLEELSDEEIEDMQNQFRKMHERYALELSRRTQSPKNTIKKEI